MQLRHYAYTCIYIMHVYTFTMNFVYMVPIFGWTFWVNIVDWMRLAVYKTILSKSLESSVWNGWIIKQFSKYRSGLALIKCSHIYINLMQTRLDRTQIWLNLFLFAFKRSHSDRLLTCSTAVSNRPNSCTCLNAPKGIFISLLDD